MIIRAGWPVANEPGSSRHAHHRPPVQLKATSQDRPAILSSETWPGITTTAASPASDGLATAPDSTQIDSGRTPAHIARPGDGRSLDRNWSRGMVTPPDPNTTAASVIWAETRFMPGEPRKLATKRLAGC